MASIVWPTGLPQRPLLDGYKEVPPKTSISTQMDVGPPKRRKRTTAGTRRFSVTYMMTKNEVDTLFDPFYLNTTEMGVLPFDIPHPRTGNVVEANIDDEPQYAVRSPGQFEVTFTLVVHP